MKVEVVLGFNKDISWIVMNSSHQSPKHNNSCKSVEPSLGKGDGVPETNFLKDVLPPSVR